VVAAEATPVRLRRGGFGRWAHGGER